MNLLSNQQVWSNLIYAFSHVIFTDDFRVVENDVYNQDWRSRGKLQIFQYQVLKWVLALFVGVVVGLVGFFNNIAVENIAGFKLLMTGDLMLKNRYESRLIQIIQCQTLATFFFIA